MTEKKILIAYATRYGSARITAGEMTTYLKKSGYNPLLIDLKKQKPPKDLKTYDLVVAGSSVAMFMWVGRVKRFIGRCKRAGVTTAVYINCGMAIEEPDKAKSRFFDKIIDQIGIKPAAEGIFGPALDFTPSTGLPESTKKRIKGVIEPMVKDKYNESGLMDMRRKEDLLVFQKELANLLR